MKYVLFIIAATGYAYAPEVKSVDFDSQVSCFVAKKAALDTYTKLGTTLRYIECIPK